VLLTKYDNRTTLSSDTLDSIKELDSRKFLG